MTQTVRKAAGQKYSSKLTCINQLPGVFKLVDRVVGWSPGTINFDNGSGRFDKGSEYLVGEGIESLPYDPFNHSAKENGQALDRASRGVDTSTISNVLNVIREADSRSAVLRLSHGYLKRGGRCFITVYEGNGSGIGAASKADCWQENRKRKDYLEEVGAVFGQGNVTITGRLIIAVK